MARFNVESEVGSMVNSSVNQARSNVLRNRTVRNTILYIVGTLLLFGLVGYMGHLLVRSLPGQTPGFWSYMIVLTCMLLLGILHVSTLRSAMPSIGSDNYLLGMLMTLLIGIVGGIAIFVLSFGPKVFGLTDVQELKANVRPLITTVLIFPLPFLLQWAFENYNRIPPKIYKLWQYNPYQQMPDLTDAEWNRNTNVVFVVDIRHGEQNTYDVVTLIPDAMNVGEGFQISSEEHNEAKPHRRIEFQQPTQPNRPKSYYQWHFYVQRPWYRPNLYIDPERNCRENFLQNGVRIIARRVG
ncbi:TssN family type VI secretion system protein [uncultured Spirosoma sp.]|uniref:TssN family type VI secretion system protein n=1 Tax=uncultured Spirosoma sp. TaxID=278208 RepID=UPI00258C80C8|nr:TssN family type VI secretion system protein [uncultured Spirosoma sp.]